MILYLLSYVAVANFVFVAGRHIFAKVGRLFQRKELSRSILGYGAASMVCALIGVQIVGEGEMIDIWSGKETIRGMSYYVTRDWRVGGWHGRLVEETGEWIRENVPKGSRLMCDWYWLDSVYFYARGDYQISQIPYLVYPKHLAHFLQAGISSTRVEKPLFMWSHLDQSSVDSHLRVLREGDLLSEIRGKNIGFIIVTHRHSFLSLYFDANPGFEKVVDWGEVKIYQVREMKPLNGFEIRIGSNTPEFLNNLDETRSKEFDLLKAEFLKGNLGLSEEEIAKIRAGEYPSVELYAVY